MYSIDYFNVEDSDEWDRFVSEADQATILHTRKFLSYHKNKFVDRSLLIRQNGELVGLFPAAESLADETHIVSHPGVTYGGIITNGKIIGEDYVTMLDEVVNYYKKFGYSSLVYKSTPFIYHIRPAEYDEYALFRCGFDLFRVDLSSTINLCSRPNLSSRRVRCIKKAVKNQVSIAHGTDYLEDVWNVLKGNLNRKHNVDPVHSLDELHTLASRFPDNIEIVAGICNGKVEAGVVLFNTAKVAHAQYIASSEVGYDFSVLDLLFSELIDKYSKLSFHWFDFGISTENQGKVLNEGLHRFKYEFGSGATTYKFYEKKLHVS